MKKIEIKTANGKHITAQIYGAEKEYVLIISSATGVKQSFYKNFADFVSANRVTVITFDYSGIGLSLKEPIKQVESNASNWEKNDLEAIIRYAKDNYSNAKITLLGHSIGGQIIGLAKSSSEVQKIILVSAQSGYWKLWKGFNKIKMWANWHILFPTLIIFSAICHQKKLAEWKIYQKTLRSNGAIGDANPTIFLTKFQNKIYFSKTFQ